MAAALLFRSVFRASQGPSRGDAAAYVRGIGVSVNTTGGHRLRTFLEDAKRGAETEYTIEVGFPAAVAGLAASHEFGEPKTKLPERPAFRNALRDMADAIRPTVVRELRRNRGTLDHAGAVSIARSAHAHIKAGYETFSVSGSPKLREGQRRRKAGTRGAGRLLVGTEGPRLINHLAAWVNGRQVA